MVILQDVLPARCEGRTAKHCVYNFYGMTGAERAKGLKVWLKEPLNEKMEGKVGRLQDGKWNWDDYNSKLFSGDRAVVMVLDK